MPRVTDNEVQRLVETSLNTTPFIEQANLIVTEELAGTDLTDARLKQIELFLAAHFVLLREERGGLAETRTGESWDKFNNQTGEGFNATRWGQQAVSLDTTGILANMATPQKKARFTVV